MNRMIITAGCEECPNNQPRSVSAAEISDIRKLNGQVLVCPHCGQQWMVEGVQVHAYIAAQTETEAEQEQWEVRTDMAPYGELTNVQIIRILDAGDADSDDSAEDTAED